MPRQTQKAHTTKPLSKRQSWVLQWFAKATTEQRDAIEGCMIAFLKDGSPLPPGWWAEDIGGHAIPMTARSAARLRVSVPRDLADLAHVARIRAAKQAAQQAVTR